MFDSSKLSAKDFILGLKHGVYVFVSDACHFCTSYKESLKLIDNANLHIVECTLDADKSAIFEITGKGALPITASFIDNALQWATMGELFDISDDPSDWTLTRLAKYLDDTFGREPLKPEEVVDKIAMLKKHCAFAYYVFPVTTSEERRKEVMDKAFEHGEIPVDIDSIDKMNIDQHSKEIIVSSNISTAKLVIFDINKTNEYSKIANYAIATYVTSKRSDAAPYEMRDL